MLDFHLADLAWVVFAACIAVAYKAGGIVSSSNKSEKSMRFDIREMKEMIKTLNEKLDTQFTELRDRVTRIEVNLKIGR